MTWHYNLSTVPIGKLLVLGTSILVTVSFYENHITVIISYTCISGRNKFTGACIQSTQQNRELDRSPLPQPNCNTQSPSPPRSPSPVTSIDSVPNSLPSGHESPVFTVPISHQYGPRRALVVPSYMVVGGSDAMLVNPLMIEYLDCHGWGIESSGALGALLKAAGVSKMQFLLIATAAGFNFGEAHFIWCLRDAVVA